MKNSPLIGIDHLLRTRHSIFTALLVCGAVLCTAAAARAADQGRTAIDSNSVRYVEIKRNDGEGRQLRLSNSQALELTRRWNEARPIGLCKFYAKYTIAVHGRNGKTRVFRATEDTMKEQNDYCFALGNHFLETLWEPQE